MSVATGPKNIVDGLVFCYDMNNTRKSWQGAPTSNVVTNSNMTGGWNLSNFSGSSATLTYETEDEIPHLKITNVVLGTGSPDYPRITDATFTQTITDGFSVSFEAKGTPGEVIKLALYSTGSTKITLAATLTNSWQRYTFNNQTTGFTLNQPYIRFDTTIAGSVRYIRKIQVEQSSFATPFVAGTRSNTQAILDLTNNNTVTANSLTYAADGTFSFNGSSNYLQVPHTANLAPTSGVTLSSWVTTNWQTTSNVRILSKTEGGGWQLSLNDDPAGGRLGMTIRVGGTYRYATVLKETVTAGYHNLAGTCDGRYVNLYIDGILVRTLDLGSILSLTYTFNNDMIIGAEAGASGPAGSNFIAGDIPVVQIYNRALSAAEVQQNFIALRGRFGI